MCLHIEEFVTERIHKGKWPRYLWKVVLTDDRSPTLLLSPLQTYTWKLGLNFSDRDSTDLHPTESFEVNEGFHVFVTKKAAIAWKASGEVPLRVRCFKKHFVAAGHHQAVFTHVFVTKKDYSDALRVAKSKSGKDEGGF